VVSSTKIKKTFEIVIYNSVIIMDNNKSINNEKDHIDDIVHDHSYYLLCRMECMDNDNLEDYLYLLNRMEYLEKKIDDLYFNIFAYSSVIITSAIYFS
jgi:hypothetical protein